MSTPRPTWMGYTIAGLTILLVAMVLASLTVSTWRMLFPRPPAPTYVCVYVTERGPTTITGSTPCPTEVAR